MAVRLNEIVSFADFHRAAPLETLPVAAEVRVFPLPTPAVEKSPLVTPLVAERGERAFTARGEGVNYELQRGGNEVLRIRRSDRTAAVETRP